MSDIEIRPEDLALAHQLHQAAREEADNEAVLIDLLAAAWVTLTGTPADEVQIVVSRGREYKVHLRRKEPEMNREVKTALLACRTLLRSIAGGRDSTMGTMQVYTPQLRKQQVDELLELVQQVVSE